MWDVGADGFDSMDMEGAAILEIANLSLDEPELESVLFTDEGDVGDETDMDVMALAFRDEGDEFGQAQLIRESADQYPSNFSQVLSDACSAVDSWHNSIKLQSENKNVEINCSLVNLVHMSLDHDQLCDAMHDNLLNSTFETTTLRMISNLSLQEKHALKSQSSSRSASV
ncbi:hypothetical protein ZIOFF_007458 [Zingiber officinale]|uniref:Uncharacterized protein n=1 Tax=Zingiber officinale TaxID=94328 RepID=A0A8J5HQR3_ZINOF|nr:hypothetical protein ZIOFF_007458 [Zingiber officinale]